MTTGHAGKQDPKLRYLIREREGATPATTRAPVDPVTGDAQMPQDADAEAGLLACLITYPDAIDEVVAILRGEEKDFYVHEHRAIYAALLALWRAGEPIDLVLVVDKLRQLGTLEDAGGVAQVSSIASLMPPPDRAERYARIVRKYAERRGDIQLAGAIAEAAYNCENEEAYTIIRHGIGESLTDNVTGDSGRFRARSLSDLRNEKRAPILDPETGLRTDQLMLIYAKENTGKSAYTHYRMARLANEGKHVYYVCGEGLSGILDRLDGIIAAHQMDPNMVEAHFHLVEEAPQFMAPAEVRELIAEAQKLPEPIALIVFDTLATATEGQNENAPEVMSAVTGGMRRIMRALDCAGILIHHSGKDATRGARGHSGLGGAVDISIEVTGEEDSDLITLCCKKSRYGAKGWKVCYQLRPITLDDHGDRTTIVAFPTDARPSDAPQSSNGPKLTLNDRKMLEVLRSLDCGMRYGAWVSQGQSMKQIPNGSAKDSIRRLSEFGMVASIDGMYKPTSLADGY